MDSTTADSFTRTSTSVISFGFGRSEPGTGGGNPPSGSELDCPARTARILSLETKSPAAAPTRSPAFRQITELKALVKVEMDRDRDLGIILTQTGGGDLERLGMAQIQTSELLPRNFRPMSSEPP